MSKVERPTHPLTLTDDHVDQTARELALERALQEILDEAKSPRRGWIAAIKAAWYVRGVVAAFTLVAFLDQLKVLPPGYLKIVHAIGAYWHQWMGILTGWLNVHLPLHLSPTEGTWLILLSVFALPMVIAKSVDDGGWLAAVVRLTATTVVVALPMQPNDMFADTSSGNLIQWIFTLLAVGLLLDPFDPRSNIGELPRVIGKYAFGATLNTALVLFVLFLIGGPNSDSAAPGGLVQELLGVLTLTLIFTGSVAVCVYAWGYWLRMWELAPGYVKALVGTLTFFGTLELLYLAPVVQEWVRPIFDQIPA